MTEHLLTRSSPRGLARMPELRGRNGETIAVTESSAATEPALCLNLKAPVAPMDESGAITGPAQVVDVAAHLDADTAWHLAEQLMVLVAEHYQGDARPLLEHRYADLRGS